MGFEPMTFPLPRGCSTTELCGRATQHHKDDNSCCHVINFCGQGGNRTPERHRRADLQSASFGHLDTCPSRLASALNSEPTARIELATLRLQGGRSAAELRRQNTVAAKTLPRDKHASRATPSSPQMTLYHKEQAGQGLFRRLISGGGKVYP